MLAYSSNRQIWLFGVGLVGAEIDAALSDQAQHIPYDWNDPEQRKDALSGLRRSTAPSLPVHVVWAAGQSGFGAAADVIDKETLLFEELIHCVEAMCRAGYRIIFHLVSSAGGLFEGQSEVSYGAAPKPLRPYGVGKLRQEQILVDSADAHGFETAIYRPSSVYGFSVSGRRGLITTLISNTLSDQETSLFGAMTTMRDYVFAPDIGTFIADQIKRGTGFASPVILASGQVASIADVVVKVASATQMQPKLKIQDTVTNGSDMSFDSSALPDNWTRTDLDSGIVTCTRLIQNHLARN